MHRKRSISSGIWENEVVQALSDPAFKIWVGVWSVSDRNGFNALQNRQVSALQK